MFSIPSLRLHPTGYLCVQDDLTRGCDGRLSVSSVLQPEHLACNDAYSRVSQILVNCDLIFRSQNSQKRHQQCS